MQRHSRDMIRHQRFRWIKRNYNLLKNVFSSYDPMWVDELPEGKLAKHSMHHHKCDMCNYRYNRAKEKESARKEMDQY